MKFKNIHITGKTVLSKAVHRALCTLHSALGTRCLALGTCLLALLALQSCSMIDEDLKPCAVKPNVITTVNFVYDYNMFREDLFNEHAGTAHLYVFDKDSVFLFDRALSRTDMTGPNVDFSMTFDTTYFRPGIKYLLVAMAQGNHGGYEASLETPGFQIPLQHQMVPGETKLEGYRIMLDRDSDSYADFGIVNYRDTYGDTKQMIDTLWSTKPNQVQDLVIPYIEYVPRVEEYPTEYVEVTIPMMRITNAVTINLVHSSFNETTDPDEYNLLIDFPKGNGTIGFTGTTYPNRELIYRTIRKETVVYKKKNSSAQYNDGTKGDSFSRADGDENTKEYSIQSTFGISRLQVTDDSSLQIWNKDFSELLFQIGGEGDQSFAQWLADYFNSSYDDQEFLDREYDFTIDIHLDDKYVWDWYQIGCSILGWGKRVYNYTLH